MKKKIDSASPCDLISSPAANAALRLLRSFLSMSAARGTANRRSRKRPASRMSASSPYFPWIRPSTPLFFTRKRYASANSLMSIVHFCFWDLQVQVGRTVGCRGCLACSADFQTICQRLPLLLASELAFGEPSRPQWPSLAKTHIQKRRFKTQGWQHALQPSFALSLPVKVTGSALSPCRREAAAGRIPWIP